MVFKRLALAGMLALALPASAQNLSEGYKFLKAVRDSDGAKVMSIVGQPGERIINAKDPVSGEGALHIVTQREDSKYLRFLLAKGADPDIRNNKDQTPAIVAVQNGFVDGLQILADANADFNIGNRSGETPLILAVENQAQPLGTRLRMIDILLKAGANPDQSDVISGLSARDYAKRQTRSPAILKAIENGGKTKPDAVYGPKL